MNICLVTDRRRLAVAVGGDADGMALLERQVRVAAESGIDLIQVREPDLDGGSLARLVEALSGACLGTTARIVVNDRLDVAVAAGASGVHLRERSYSCRDARRMAPDDFLVGRSVHSVAAMAGQSDADYWIAGTVRVTPSKPGAVVLGWEGLRAIVRAAGRKPVFGIGGLEVSSIPRLAQSGAGFAAIGAFIPATGEDIAKFVQKRVSQVRLAFDS